MNIQYPFSQLILAGAKTAEVRDYPLGHRNIAVPGERMWLVETVGPECAPTKHAIIPGVDVGARPAHAHIVGVIEFSSSEPYECASAFHADAAAHCIREGGCYDWAGVGGRHRWRIAGVRRLAAPVATKTGMTGFGERSFAVTFLSPTARGTHPEAPSKGAGSAKGGRQEGKGAAREADDSRRREVEAEKARRMEIYEEVICGLLARKDYKGAAAVQKMKEEMSASTDGAGEAAVRRRREAEAEKAARVEKYEEEIRGLLARKDYAGAAAVQQKIRELSGKKDAAEEAPSACEAWSS